MMQCPGALVHAGEIRQTTLAKVISMNTGAELTGNSFKV